MSIPLLGNCHSAHRAEPATKNTLFSKDSNSYLESLGLYLNKPEPAIICQQCKYALKPSGDCISKHLGEKHNVSTAARRGLKAFVVSLRLPDPNKLPPRQDGCSPHPYLSTDRGTACRLCKFYSTSGDLMQRHLSRRHGLKHSGKNWRGDSIDNDVGLQSWTKNRRREYWIVKTDKRITRSNAGLSADSSPRRQQRVAALHEEEQQRLIQVDRNRSVTDTGVDDFTLTSNWMRRTGWAATFAGSDRHLLSLLDQNPTHDGQLHPAQGRADASGTKGKKKKKKKKTLIRRAIRFWPL